MFKRLLSWLFPKKKAHIETDWQSHHILIKSLENNDKLAGKIKTGGLLANINVDNKLPRMLAYDEFAHQQRVTELQLEGKTHLREWMHDMRIKKKISTRLYKQLCKYAYRECLEDMTMRDFMQYRGNGIKAWEEFSILRKKYLKNKKNGK